MRKHYAKKSKFKEELQSSMKNRIESLYNPKQYDTNNTNGIDFL